MAKKSKKKNPHKQQTRNKPAEKQGSKNKSAGKISFRWIAGGIGLIVVAAVLYWSTLENGGINLLAGNQETVTDTADLPAGTPRLSIDQDRIDFGDVGFNIRKTFSFTVTNTGNDVLKFTGAPRIEVVAGC
ncbi:MAG: hypothetical protein ABIK68_12475 [bacterium]